MKYGDHQWLISVDLKMLNFLLGQQGCYTKYPCFLCYWDSRADKDHWVRKKWLSRHRLMLGEKNIINKPPVDQKNIILPPLHIKLDIMKQFIKALDRDSDWWWKTGIKVVGTRIWCQITAGVWWELLQMLYIKGRHQKENLPQTVMICVSANQTTLLLHIFWLDITFFVHVIYV